MPDPSGQRQILDENYPQDVTANNVQDSLDRMDRLYSNDDYNLLMDNPNSIDTDQDQDLLESSEIPSDSSSRHFCHEICATLL